MSVFLSLKSKRFNCEMKLNEKVTFIWGSSGQGKTEFTRRIQSKSSMNKLSISNGFDAVVLTSELFNQSYKLAMRSFTGNTDERKTVRKHLEKYWSDEDNFPYKDHVLIIDDEDFVKSDCFAVYFNCDKSNYYIIINRSKLPMISYSANEVYRFVADGANHYIERYFKYSEDTTNTSISSIDTAIVEGVGSDFVFFSNLLTDDITVLNPTSFGTITDGGRDNVVKFIETEYSKLLGKRILLIVDFCAFGSNINELYNLCQSRGLNIIFDRDYLSFEYLLLRSNFINDLYLDSVIESDRLKHYSLEDLFTKRLISLTRDCIYSYSKSSDEFSVCYYLDCCKNKRNKGTCSMRRSGLSKNKLTNLLRGTKFEYLLERHK